MKHPVIKLLLGGLLVLGTLSLLGPKASMVNDYPKGWLSFPLPETSKFRKDLVFHVDHDGGQNNEAKLGEGVSCTTYNGKHFPHCYDGHSGTDYLLRGGFKMMDSFGSAEIHAAASGVVVAKSDGNYDHCHFVVIGATVSCDGNPMDANYVQILHANGYSTLYYHMKKDSIAVEVGDTVNCDQFLGLVGSSGYSSMPHLHFEVIDPAGQPVDPYVADNPAQNSMWSNQESSTGLPAANACAL